MRLPNTVAALLSVIFMASGAGAIEVKDLRCEYFRDPLGIDAEHPQLGWVIRSDQRADRQSAYQVLVASTPEALAKDSGDLWDSGKVASDQTAHVPYAGTALRSGQLLYWKVRAWSKDDAASPWSETSFWSMGLLQPADWSGKWITASRWWLAPANRPPGFIVGAGGWTDVSLAAPVAIDSIKLYPRAGSAFPLRFKIEVADDPSFDHPRTLVDKTGDDFAPPAAGPVEFAVNGITAGYVRLTVTAVRDPKGKATVRQMEVLSGGRNVALMRPTREYGADWSRGHAVFLVDGMPSNNDGATCPPEACPATAAPLLRRAFDINRDVARAMLYFAAMGMADVTINGKPITDAVNGPPFTDYTRRVTYVTHDVTPLVGRGENVIGIVLGNGFFSPPSRGFGERHSGHGPPRVLAQLQIEYKDGTRQTVATDDAWKWSRGEITSNDVFQGYAEDRRLARPGWDRAGFDDRQWQTVTIAPSLDGATRARMGPPVRILGELKPTRVEANHAHFNVLTAGWPRVTVNGKAGQTITIIGKGPKFSLPKLTFTLANDGPAVLQPRFIVLSGPLDLEVAGLNEPLSPDAVSIQLVRADMQTTGAFACSNPWLNEVYQALVQTHQNYDEDFPADPTREKQGWTQDAQNMFETATYLTDSAALYRKWWWDFADGQDENGCTGSVLPVVGRQVSDWNSPWWSGVIVYLPWKHYEYYGDRRMLAEAYAPMCRYVDFLGKLAAAGAGKAWGDYPYLSANLDSAAAKERMIIWNGAGDWHNPFTQSQNAVPTPMTTMPAWYYYATIASKSARILGKEDDSAKYAAIAQDVKARFNTKYFHADTGWYGDKTDAQTGQVLPLALGMVPEGKWDLAYQRLIDAIHARNDHVGTGFVALPFLLQILAEQRETALANKIVNQQDFPGWKTLMHDGILGEDWKGGGAQMPSTGGAIGMWLYQSVLGIRPDPAGPGFQRFILAPQPDPATGLTSANGFFDCIRGRIGSDWSCGAGRFRLHATIPANTVATVYVPTKDADSVRESDQPARTAPGVKFIRSETGAAVYQVESGEYRFEAAY